MKVISVIVPIYNVERYLDRCVQSIFNQTYSNYELILVDDGSPDNCGEMCEQYAKKDGRVRVVHKENGGLSDARNAGLSVAQGEYIVFVDSDDWLLPQYLEYLLQTLEETKSDIVECEIVKTSNESESIHVDSAYEMKCYNTEEALECLIRDHEFHQYVWNKLYKRQVIDDIFFEKGKTNEDEYWTYQIFGKANKITKINIPLYYYFQRETSIMGIGYNIRRLDALEAKEIRQKYIEEEFPQLATVAKVNLINSCIYAGQMTLKFLQGQEQKQAKEVISTVIKDYRIEQEDKVCLSWSEKFWIVLAQRNFWFTCLIKNILKRGF